MQRTSMGLAMAALAACAGCNDQKPAAPAQASPTDAVRAAALQSLAATPGMPANVRFRGVQAYAEAMPGQTAICGQVTPFSDDTTIFVPFVTVAKQSSASGATPHYDFVSEIGTDPDKATRVYTALVAYCWNGGGLSPDELAALPPLPGNVPDPRGPDDSSPTQAASSAHAAGTVRARRSTNLRRDPGGAVVAHVARGSVLTVFAQAPGGWYQVGAGSTSGWVHESMLQR